MCLLLVLVVTGNALAAKYQGDGSRIDDRHNYDMVDSSSPKPSGECLSNSGNADNCESRVSHPDTIDKPFQMKYRLQQIDRLFDENQVADSDLEAEGASTTLRQVLLLHRHGDRTPVVFDPEDPLAKEPFWAFHGLGQLTNRGKARLYLLGKMMRTRYDKFLKGKVNKNERISRSSGVLRCIESAQTFLASFLSLNESSSDDAPKLVWDRRVNILAQLWQPVNIQSVPAKLDAMLAESAECKAFTNEQENVIENSAEAQQMYVDYKYEKTILENSIGRKVTRFYMWMWSASLIEVERSYFADKMKFELINIYDRLMEAGSKAMGLYASTVKARRLRSGLLMGDMIRNMILFRDTGNQANTMAKKFLHYSAHDLTLVTVLSMLDMWNKFPSHPDYGSNLSLELHHDEQSDEWFVRFFYMSPVPSAPNELHLPNCESDHPKSRCTLDKFQQIMQPYTIDSWKDWMKECGNDYDNLDPYGTAS